MAKLVEQVNKDGQIVIDYDNVLSRNELLNLISVYFPNIHCDQDGMICGDYKGKRFSIRAKNITYLGHPHPHYKKRIQISTDLYDFYESSISKNRVPFLLGVYSYKDNIIFCDFNIEDYINKKAHNSSAHVFTDNLADATIDHYFEKVDYLGNRITAFSIKGVETFLRDKLAVKYSTILQSETDSSIVGDLSHAVSTDFKLPKDIQKGIMNFFNHIEKEWNGIDCYKMMVASNYRNKFQPEWPGFYLEYEFEKYLNRNNLLNLIHYAQDKKNGGIDLDLYFPTIGMFGDLKAHSKQSKGIQGNDQKTVLRLLERENHNHVYYIVCEHETEKDSDFGYVVTHYWNRIQNKSDLMSYSKRMKNSVRLTKAYILDINKNNMQFLSTYRQGLNSNGKPREPKIMIDHEKLSKFLVVSKKL